jgi:hypothetical protein
VKRFFIFVAALLSFSPGLTLQGGAIEDALSFAFEASSSAVKEGFTIREEWWGGDLPVGQPKPIPHQLFKGNDYWFWMGTSVKGASISVHIYDSDGKLAEDEVLKKTQGGQKAGARIKPKRSGTYYLLVEIEKSPEDRTVWALAYGFR